MLSTLDFSQEEYGGEDIVEILQIAKAEDLERIRKYISECESRIKGETTEIGPEHAKLQLRDLRAELLSENTSLQKKQKIAEQIMKLKERYSLIIDSIISQIIDEMALNENESGPEINLLEPVEGQAVADAEHTRLVEEMRRLSKRNAWKGVETAFQELGLLQKQNRIQLTYEDYWLGAQSARALGDINGVYERLRGAANLNASQEAIEWLSDLDAHYNTVKLKNKRGEPVALSAAAMPFAPDQRACIETAIRAVNINGEYTGLLPAGSYTFGDEIVIVAIGGGGVDLTLTTNDETEQQERTLERQQRNAKQEIFRRYGEKAIIIIEKFGLINTSGDNWRKADSSIHASYRFINEGAVCVNDNTFSFLDYDEVSNAATFLIFMNMPKPPVMGEIASIQYSIDKNGVLAKIKLKTGENLNRLAVWDNIYKLANATPIEVSPLWNY
ncbi:MAG: hypothetical protein V1898_01430 [Patescibacteria group bacterium]